MRYSTMNHLFFRSLVVVTTLTSAVASQANDRLPEQVYRSTCAFCHGHYVAPGVTVAPVLLGRQLDPAVIQTFVRNNSGRMPVFRPSEINDAELAGLARWIQTSEAPAMPPPPGARP